MTHTLLEFNPAIDELMPAARHPAAAQDIEAASALLEAADSGDAEAAIVELIDRARPPGQGLARPVVVALARALGRTARRVLRRRDAPRSVAVGRLFGLELEGLSGEDQHFEIARQFVRLVRSAARSAHAVQQALPIVAPAAQAQRAVRAAARHWAPGLVPLLPATPASPGGAFASSSFPSARLR